MKLHGNTCTVKLLIPLSPENAKKDEPKTLYITDNANIIHIVTTLTTFSV